MVSRKTRTYVKQGVAGGALIWIVMLFIQHQTKVSSPSSGDAEMVKLRGIKNSQTRQHIYNRYVLDMFDSFFALFVCIFSEKYLFKT